MKNNTQYLEKIFLVIAVVLFSVLDNSFMPFISIKGVFPSLLFTFLIAYSIVRGKNEAVIIGVAAGLLQDVFFYNGLGINAFANMIVCLLAAIIGENVYKDKRLVPVFVVFVATVLKVFIICAIFKVKGLEVNVNTALLSSIYNAVLMMLGYKFILKLYDNETNKISWRFK